MFSFKIPTSGNPRGSAGGWQSQTLKDRFTNIIHQNIYIYFLDTYTRMMYIQCVNNNTNFTADTSAERGPEMDLTYTTTANGELAFTAISNNAKLWLAGKLGAGAVSFTIPAENLQQVVDAAIASNLICRLA
jgi:hypothetical protein